jgi:hypothetical protein
VSVSRLNPELLRNLRIQLRPRRMIAAAAVCAAISISAITIFLHDRPAQADAPDLLRVIALLQLLALLIGGGIYCIQSVHTEKDQNTFDYQRLTPMSPLRLAVGKLFGAPALAYFVVLCLMPIALFGAYVGRVGLVPFLDCYLILLLGCLTYHSLALLTSLFLVRGSSAGAIIFYLGLAWLGSVDVMSNGGPLAIRTLGPAFAFAVIDPDNKAVWYARSGPLWDQFFGAPVAHMWVLAVLYAIFTAWFLLALARNLKRDPSAYEIFSPLQGFAFAMFLIFLLLGFYQWVPPQIKFLFNGEPRVTAPPPPGEAEATILGFSLPLFAIFGLSLLRNREVARRRICALGARAKGWVAAFWPTPYLLAGALVIGFALLELIRHKLPESDDWSLGTGSFIVVVFALWLSRDVLYLQWMNLRRSKHPLVMSVLYMIVFYSCSSALLAAFDLFTDKDAPYAAALVPGRIFDLKYPDWVAQRGAWIAGATLIAAQALLFAALQRRELRKLAAASAISSVSQSSHSS